MGRRDGTPRRTTPHLPEPDRSDRQDGLIVNISSISGVRAAALGGVAYNASKFACAVLGISVANEEIPNNIRVTTVYPGEVDTPILEHRPVPVSDERRAKMLLPEDLGAMVVAIARCQTKQLRSFSIRVLNLFTQLNILEVRINYHGLGLLFISFFGRVVYLAYYLTG